MSEEPRQKEMTQNATPPSGESFGELEESLRTLDVRWSSYGKQLEDLRGMFATISATQTKLFEEHLPIADRLTALEAHLSKVPSLEQLQKLQTRLDQIGTDVNAFHKFSNQLVELLTTRLSALEQQLAVSKKQ